MASRKTGTFAACWLDEASGQRLHQHFRDVPGVKEAERFHLTTTYTGAILPGLQSRWIDITLDHGTFAYDMFGDDNSLLVLKVRSEGLLELHREALALGAVWDYPVYKAHLTLSDGFDGDLAGLPPLPAFDLVVDRFIVEPLPRQKTLPVLPRPCAA